MNSIKRNNELQRLLQAYEAIQQKDRMQLCLIVGEAGAGKTVLLNQFLDEVSEKNEQTLLVSSFCSIRSEYNIPYQLFKELLKQLLNDVSEDEARDTKKVKKEKRKETLLFCAKTILEQAPDLLGNFIPGVPVLSAVGQFFLKEKEKKPIASVEESKIIEQYVDAIRAIASKYKLVLILDNLQWIDNSSVNLLYQLVVGLRNSPVFIIGCYRSTDIDIDVDGEKHPLSRLITEVKIGYGNVFINLDLLDSKKKRIFMNQMLDSEKNIYDDDFRDKLFERTNGNPLFVTELLNLLKEEGLVVSNNDGVWMNNACLYWDSYPVRIEGIIQERIGRLEDSLLEVLSYASVQGYNFIAQVLSKTMDAPERELLLTLSKVLQKQHHLVEESDCIRSSHGIMSRFNFSNYIFQQYLYKELSMTQRMMLHSDIAKILEDYFKDRLDEVAGDIARHYEMSEEFEKAVKYIKITVDSMLRVSGYEEAGLLIRKALGFLENMEQSEDVKLETLHFTLQLCICYRSTKGWGDVEVEQLYKKTSAMCKDLQNFENIDIVLFGKWAIHLAKLNLDLCLKQALRNLDMSKKYNNKKAYFSALVSLTNTFFWLGDFENTVEYGTTFLRESEQDEEQKSVQNFDSLLVLMFLLLVVNKKSEKEKAIKYKRQILDLRLEYKDSFFQAIACQALCWYCWDAGEWDELDSLSAEFMKMSEKHHFYFYLGIASLFRGASLYQKDINSCEAEGMIKKGYAILTDSSKSSPTSMHSVYGVILGKYYLERGEDEQFNTFIDNIIETSTQLNERAYLDRLYQLKMIYYNRVGNVKKEEEYRRKALQIIQELNSKRRC